MVMKGKTLEQHSKIGGMLWLPALWTVTNVLMAGYYATILPMLGCIMMVFAIINAYLFWTRSFLYRWYFIVQTMAGMVFLMIVAGPGGVGNGSAFSIFIMFYLLFSKRARGTFTQPLLRRSNPEPVQ